MSMTFTKLFSSITESTLWTEDDRTRIVWITMLAMADKHGRVWASVPGLANRARVPLEACLEAINKFLGPDKFSRTKDHDGRRIEEIDGGWRLLNYEKYRAIRDHEAIKESKRLHINTKREIERSVKKSAKLSKSVKDSERQVKDGLHSSTVENFSTVDRSRHNAEAEAEADKEGDLDLRDRQVAILKAAYAAEFPDVDLTGFDKAFQKALRGVEFKDLMEAFPIVAKRVKSSSWANTHSPAAVLDPPWFWNELQVAGMKE